MIPGRAAAVAVSVLALVATSACGSTGAPSRSATPAPSGPSPALPITLGVAASLTGGESAYDVPLLDAERLAVADINSKGGVLGRPLRIVTADNKTDPSLVISAAQQVLDEGADFVIPTCDYDYGAPAAKLAQSQGKVAITCAGDPRFGFTGVGALTFSSFQGTPTESGALAQFAAYKGVKHPYLLVDTMLGYTRDACSDFRTAFEHVSAGGSIAGQDAFQNADASITSQIGRLRQNSAADAVVLCSYLPGGANALKELRDAGVNLPIYTLTTFDGTFWTKAVPTLSDVYFAAVGAVTGDDPDPQVNDFFKRFQASTGKPALFSLYLLGYSAVQTLALGIAKAGTVDGAKVAGAIETLNKEPLLAGPTTYSRTCHLPLGRPLRVMQFQDGKLSYVQLLTPYYLPPSPC